MDASVSSISHLIDHNYCKIPGYTAVRECRRKTKTPNYSFHDEDDDDESEQDYEDDELYVVSTREPKTSKKRGSLTTQQSKLSRKRGVTPARESQDSQQAYFLTNHMLLFKNSASLQGSGPPQKCVRTQERKPSQKPVAGSTIRKLNMLKERMRYEACLAFNSVSMGQEALKLTTTNLVNMERTNVKVEQTEETNTKPAHQRLSNSIIKHRFGITQPVSTKPANVNPEAVCTKRARVKSEVVETTNTKPKKMVAESTMPADVRPKKLLTGSTTPADVKSKRTDPANTKSADVRPKKMVTESSKSENVKTKNTESAKTKAKNMEQKRAKRPNEKCDDEPKSKWAKAGNITKTSKRTSKVYKSVKMNMYSCEICGKTFRTQAGLLDHRAVHKGKGRHFKCLLCKENTKSFNFMYQLNLHIRKKHSTVVNIFMPIPEMRGRPRADQNYRCEDCARSFKIRKELMSHYYTAHSDKYGSVKKNREGKFCSINICNLLTEKESVLKEPMSGKPEVASAADMSIPKPKKGKGSVDNTAGVEMPEVDSASKIAAAQKKRRGRPRKSSLSQPVSELDVPGLAESMIEFDEVNDTIVAVQAFANEGSDNEDDKRECLIQVILRSRRELCDICKVQKFENDDEFHIHVQTTHPDPFLKFHCNLCPEMFRLKSYYNFHMERKHNL